MELEIEIKRLKSFKLIVVPEVYCEIRERTKNSEKIIKKK